MIDRIIAPCKPNGIVNSVWFTNPNGGPPELYAVEDSDSKDAECRCPFGACCVNGRNEIIQGIVLTAGGPQNLK